jgi:hypothetical protein
VAGSKVKVRFTADTKDLERGTRQSEKALAGFGKAGAKFGAGLVGVGLGIDAVSTGLRTMVSEARESQKVTAQTNAVLKSTGGVANVTAREIEKLSNSLSIKAGIDDEAVQSAQNLLLTFKNVQNQAGQGNKIFNQSTKAIVDMSAAMGKDLNSTTLMVGKALNDPIKGITALTRVGVTFTQQQRDQIAAMVENGNRMGAQKMILKELNSEFAGSAAANADPIDRMNVAVKNLAETAGLKLAPHLAKAADAMTNLLTGKGGGNAFAGIKLNIQGFSHALGMSKKDIRQFGEAMSNVWKAIRAITRAVWPGIKQTVQGQLKQIGGVVKVFSSILRGDFRGMWNGIKQIFSAQLEIIKGRLRSAAGAFKVIGGAIGKALMDGIKGAISAVGDAGKGIANAVINLLNSAIPNKIAIPGAPDIDFPDNPIPRFAAGGRVPKSPMQLVGEKGPELVSLPAGSYVHNNTKTRAMLSDGTVVNSYANGGRIGRMIGRAVGISNKRQPYLYGGGHGSFNDPRGYDCSGYVSTILNAGGFLGSPITTDGVKSMPRGVGQFVTVGVRGSSGRNAHTMMAIRDPKKRKWRYFESGGGHGAMEVGGWNGSFAMHHPNGEEKLAAELLKPKSKFLGGKGVTKNSKGGDAGDQKARGTVKMKDPKGSIVGPKGGAIGSILKTAQADAKEAEYLAGGSESSGPSFADAIAALTAEMTRNREFAQIVHTANKSVTDTQFAEMQNRSMGGILSQMLLTLSPRMAT